MYEKITGCTKCSGAIVTRKVMDCMGGSFWSEEEYCICCGLVIGRHNPTKEELKEYKKSLIGYYGHVKEYRRKGKY